MKLLLSTILFLTPALASAQEFTWFTVDGKDHFQALHCIPGSIAELFSSVDGGKLLRSLPILPDSTASIIWDAPVQPRMLLNGGTKGSNKVSFLPAREFSIAGAAIARRTDAVELSWDAETANPADISFEVRRSAGGSAFSTLITINAYSGAVIHRYRFTDDTPLPDAVYQIVVRSSAKGARYSSQRLHVENGKQVLIYPTVVEKDLTIFTQGNAANSYRILTQDGRVVKTGPLSSGESTISLHLLPAGTYFAQVTGDGYRKQVQILKR